MEKLTAAQVEAIEAAGAEVADAWVRSCPETNLPRDYDFSCDGDWQCIREAALAAGVEWEGVQPALEVRSEVWRVARRGYLAVVEANSQPPQP